MFGLLGDHTLRVVAAGAITLGIVSGVLGSFAVLRRQSLLGDAISHAALPGIAIAFMLTGSKSSIVLMTGAAVAGSLGTLAVMGIVGASRIKYDAALGIVLSVFFGLGLVLLTFIQNTPEAAQAGLDKFLFGQAASLLESDVIAMVIVAGVVLTVVALLWKELKLLGFDPDFGDSAGFPMSALDVVLTTLLVIAIVLGLQAVGVVLMSAMVVAPAAAARQWTDRLGVMVVLSAIFGALAGVTGALFSSSIDNLPTGPAIVLCVSAIVGLSLLCAPHRGLLSQLLLRVRNRRRVRISGVLEDLRALGLQHAGVPHGHPIGAIEAMSEDKATVAPALDELERRGWARQGDRGDWWLTEGGRAEAERRFGEETEGAGADR